MRLPAPGLLFALRVDAVRWGLEMERILVALDGSEASEKALELASDLARAHGAELMLLHVVSDQSLSDGERHMAEVEYLGELLSGVDIGGVLRSRGDPRVTAQRLLADYGDVARRLRETFGSRLLDQARARVADKRVQTVSNLLEVGDPAKTILRVAQDQAVDMIVLGSRGLGDAEGLLLGSVSHKVAHLAACTCVTVR
jgi:nucleotide-binding universal stress UspA family protein